MYVYVEHTQNREKMIEVKSQSYRNYCGLFFKSHEYIY